MGRQKYIIDFAIVYSVCLSIARFIISEYYSSLGSSEYLFFFLFSFINEFVIGLALGAIFSIQKTRGLNIFLGFLFCLIVSLQIAIFHYESVFGRIPAYEMIYYLSELDHLAVSLESNIPLYFYILELLVLVAIFLTGVRYLNKYNYSLNNQVLVIVAILAVSASFVIQANATNSQTPRQWQSRQPLVWLVQSAFMKEGYRLEELTLESQDFELFRTVHGLNSNLPVINKDNPMCRFVTQSDAQNTYKNAIVLILESVGLKEMYSQFGNQDLMPNLKAIAAQNLIFKNAHAPSEKSVTSLTSLFSGLPENPFNRYLWQAPIVTLNGFPSYLKDEGLSTGYFHGADLSFENQRLYLQNIGFETIFEYDPEIDQPVYGWGYDDEFVFKQLMNWVTDAKKNNVPYFATLFTLSTHDPYFIPEDWSERIQNSYKESDPECCEDIDSLMEEDIAYSYRYLDEQLAVFYKWFTDNTEDTVLIITGDHVPHFNNETQGGFASAERFDVPIIVAGLNDDDLENYRSYSTRLAGTQDIPATIMKLLNKSYLDCGLGLDLFMSENQWPEERLLYSFSGDAMERMYLQLGDRKIRLDRQDNKYTVLNSGSLDGQDNDETIELVRQMVSLIYPVHYYLINTDSYYSEIDGVERPPVEPLAGGVIYASHRGNVSGPTGKFTENSREAIEAVIQSDFEWMELDVQVSEDGVPFVFHDLYIDIEGERYIFSFLTLDEIRQLPGMENVLTLEGVLASYSQKINLLIEIKTTNHVFNEYSAINNVTELVNRYRGEKSIIVDTFSDLVATSVKQHCNCEVGYDTPFRQPITLELLQQYSDLGYDWIYVHSDILSKDLVDQAHALGIRVMVYTVNDKELVESWASAGILPDGIITDTESLIP